jgi:hypothetical protein
MRFGAALGDDARDPRVVRTFHGFGYVFAAEAVPDDTPAPTSVWPRAARCWLVTRGREFALTDGEHIIGRESGADVWLDSPRVSRRHARIHVEGARVVIEDLGSKNGTLVGETRIGGPTGLASGDRIRIGPFRLTVRVRETAGSTETEGVTWTRRRHPEVLP